MTVPNRLEDSLHCKKTSRKDDSNFLDSHKLSSALSSDGTTISRVILYSAITEAMESAIGSWASFHWLVSLTDMIRSKFNFKLFKCSFANWWLILLRKHSDLLFFIDFSKTVLGLFNEFFCEILLSLLSESGIVSEFDNSETSNDLESVRRYKPKRRYANVFYSDQSCYSSWSFLCFQAVIISAKMFLKIWTKIFKNLRFSQRAPNFNKESAKKGKKNKSTHRSCDNPNSSSHEDFSIVISLGEKILKISSVKYTRRNSFRREHISLLTQLMSAQPHATAYNWRRDQ